LCSYNCALTIVLLQLCSYNCALTIVHLLLCSYNFALTIALLQLCSYNCALTIVLLQLCSYNCALIIVLLPFCCNNYNPTFQLFHLCSQTNSQKCTLTFELSHLSSHNCAPTIVLSQLCSHNCALVTLLLHLCFSNRVLKVKLFWFHTYCSYKFTNTVLKIFFNEWAFLQQMDPFSIFKLSFNQQNKRNPWKEKDFYPDKKMDIFIFLYHALVFWELGLLKQAYVRSHNRDVTHTLMLYTLRVMLLLLSWLHCCDRVLTIAPGQCGSFAR